MVKQKLERAVLVLFKEENCHNKMTSLGKSCISKSIKKRRLLYTEKFGNIFAFEKESKRKSNYLYQLTVLLKIIGVLP